jgi:hypothetical protein
MKNSVVEGVLTATVVIVTVLEFLETVPEEGPSL